MSELYIDEIFTPAKEYLLRKQDEREELIRLGRDITSYSKKAIFSLHRSFSEQLQHEQAMTDLTELKQYLQILGTGLIQVKSLYEANINLRGNVAGPIEELIEFFTFGYFITNEKLLQYDQFISYIQILLDHNTKESHDVILKSLLFDVPIPAKYSSKTEVKFIDIGDYLMGLLDCTGEIMRLSIQQSSQYEGTLQLETTQEQYRYLQDFYHHLMILTGHYPGLSVYRGVFENSTKSKGNISFMKKLQVFHTSIRKIETTLLDILISDRETI
ncbi:hypothetical protein JA1_003513 [Spathaspora sp. JA1]|nr:hypothetical protein JA1_003513 [Spathaspora sp. JA1]